MKTIFPIWINFYNIDYETVGPIHEYRVGYSLIVLHAIPTKMNRDFPSDGSYSQHSQFNCLMTRRLINAVRIKDEHIGNCLPLHNNLEGAYFSSLNATYLHFSILGKRGVE